MSWSGATGDAGRGQSCDRRGVTAVVLKKSRSFTDVIIRRGHAYAEPTPILFESVCQNAAIVVWFGQ